MASVLDPLRVAVTAAVCRVGPTLRLNCRWLCGLVLPTCVRNSAPDGRDGGINTEQGTYHSHTLLLCTSVMHVLRVCHCHVCHVLVVH